MTLWEVFTGVDRSLDRLRAFLQSASKKEIRKLYKEFEQLRADIAFELTNSFEEISENSLNDVAEYLIQGGSIEVQAVMKGTYEFVPDPEIVSDCPVSHAFHTSYFARFGEGLLD